MLRVLGLLAPLARARRPLAAALTSGVVLLALTSCGGGEDKAAAEPSPSQVMAAAKKTLDDTTGVKISLATQDLPAGTSGLTTATGVGVHPPAFDGTITVSLSGNTFEVPVVAVDDKVFVQLPLTSGFQDVDPRAYGAPDPAQLMSPDAGFSALLTSTTGLKKGTSVRGGSDNSEILTQYTGTVPDSAVKNVIPTARGDFDATYTVTDSGELRQARLTGAFYPKAATMTYTVGFDDYGTQKKIVAP
jgi:lipoprotein LprG